MLLIVCVHTVLTLKSGSMLAVQTASMLPVFGPGDALIIKTSPKSFSVGQVVSYRSRKDPRQIVSHRVVALDETQQQLITKGDHLAEADPPIRYWDVSGTALYIVPKGGYVLSFMYTWRGLVSVIYLPALLILLFEVRRINIRQNSTFYLNGNQKKVIVTARRQQRAIIEL